MKVGILGLGTMGANHLRVLRDIIGVDEVVIFDSSRTFLDRKISGVFKCDSFEEFKEKQQELFYSVIATPTVFHEAHLGLFIENHWNALVEKPLALNLDQGKKLLELAKFSKSKIGVGHIERFNPAIIEGKKKLNSGLLGNIFRIHTVRQGPNPIRITDVGVLADLATHDIDLIHYLTDDVYEYVFADITFQPGRKREDAILVMGRTKDGISILHNVNWLSPKKERLLTIMGEKGTLVIDSLQSELFFYENASMNIEDERIASFKGVSEGNAIRYAFGKKEALLSEHLEFMKWLANDDNHSVKIKEALKTLVVVESILESFKLCRKVGPSYV